MINHRSHGVVSFNEKIVVEDNSGHDNPVVESSKFVYDKTNIVKINEQGVRNAARYIRQKLVSETYTPWSWREHALHICPPEQYSASDPRTRATLDWIFLISTLNFSFWSEREGNPDRYGVEWREGWGKEGREIWTGYWSLVAALDRAIERGIPITDPKFYSSTINCPDSLIEEIFKPANQSSEGIPLLEERIAAMREVGFILCHSYGGSFQGFVEEFQRRYDGKGTAIQLVKMVTDTFPSFRDENWFEGKKVYFWKRAQILVAETWAAFYPLPPASSSSHPFFPSGVHELTMFADYRVPQILHHLSILTYPPSLNSLLKAHTPVAHGSREELSIRAASILAVEAIRDEIRTLSSIEGAEMSGDAGVSSVLIDFYLWDLAKRVEDGEVIEDIETSGILPAHRTRSIWY